jgi:hypothetical protein
MDNKILYTAKFTHPDLKFHKVEIGQKMWKLVQINGQTDSYIPPPPPNYVCGGIIILFTKHII